MGRKKKHIDEAAKKAADANRKKLKRAADKMANQIKAAEKENIQWISELLMKLVNLAVLFDAGSASFPISFGAYYTRLQ